MDEFLVLIVEDDKDNREYAIKLVQRDSLILAGPGRRIHVTEASNQQEAEAAVSRVPLSGYNLIILDLEYGKDSNSPLDFIGIRWLPLLRALQPDATIVVWSNYGMINGLRFVVDALRDGAADDFIPKGEPWEQVRARVVGAMRDRRRKSLRKLPRTSNVARISSEDILGALTRARSKMESEQQVSNTEPAGLSRAFDDLEGELKSITSRLIGKFADAPESVNCVELARDEALLVEAQLARPIVVEPFESNPRIRTYHEDLRTALREILQNAVDATKEAPRAEEGQIRLRFLREADSKQFSISVSDSGPGFSKPALNRLYEPGKSYWQEDTWRHKGMGLYVARRLMHSIGGDVAIANQSTNPTTVSLSIRDWA